MASPVPLGLLALGLLLLGGCAVAPHAIAPPTPEEIPRLEASLAERPSDVDLLLRVGAAYREGGRLGEARAALERAHALSPEHAGVLFYLGLVREEQEDWEAAGEAYRAFLESDAPDGLREHVRRRLPLVRREALMASVRSSLAREAELADPAPRLSTVAVFPFRYEGTDPELAPLGRALAELTVTDLGITGRLTVLERLRVQLLLDEMALAEEGLVDPATAARSGRLLGAGQVVQASIAGEEERLEVLAAAVLAATGRGAEPVEEADALREVYELQRRLVLALHASLGIELTPAERDLIMERPTRSLSALLLFGRALEAEDRGDFDEAADLFEQAVAEDPGFDGAREGRDRSTDASAARDTSAQELAHQGYPDMPPGPGAVDSRQAFQDVEALIPNPAGRDPSAELLGQEGIGGSGTVIEIILRPPGGGS
jgi:tetratricopeptide (TPR) repeat protein